MEYTPSTDAFDVNAASVPAVMPLSKLIFLKVRSFTVPLSVQNRPIFLTPPKVIFRHSSYSIFLISCPFPSSIP